MNQHYARNPLLNNAMLPVDIVLAPEWWHRHAGICCINMDDKVSDSQVDVVFETVDTLRRKYKNREQ